MHLAIDIATLYCSVAALGREGGKKNRSKTTTNTDEVWTRRGREFKQAGSLAGVVSDRGGGGLRVVGWVRVCGGWRRHLDEERQLQEFSRQRENNQAGEHRKAHIRH